ncbi:unnamed protein product [Rotaria socialis]|uniref:Peptidase metallopeptidase domain-containing protein n=1 Tax=Rotaria socialis TaxID=392032 RepID=A0A820DXL6_9BILA|nr:unnamed protein product [Rotaria socialis]CAF4307313.1 unnamed protein product [Rotaria socialis]
MRFVVSFDRLLLLLISFLLQHVHICLTFTDNNRLYYAKEFLHRFGYIKTNDSSLEIAPPAVKAFQRFIGLNQTGIIDELTWQKMREPRCGNKDLRRIQRRKRYILQGSRWPSNEPLTFRIVKYPTTFPQQFVDAELTKALKLWSSASSLEFEHRKLKKRDALKASSLDHKTDIRISFEIGDHGDTEPFDGPGNVLGHAFFPQYGGDAHFDNDEYWTMKSTDGVNLFQVAAHEFGHSLGLEHSNKPDAIMAPFFKGYTSNFTLQEDDIRAIQALYGGKPSKSFSSPLSNSIETFQPASKQMAPSVKSSNKVTSLCQDPQFDAIITIDDDTYIFKDHLVYRRSKSSMDTEYPKPIRDVFGRWEGGIWQTIPDKIDTALTWPNQQIFFFKGKHYWKTIRFQLQTGYPRLIRDGFRGLDEQHFFTGHLNAAFVYSGDNHTYFIKDAMIWRLHMNLEFSSSIDIDYPQFVSRWLNIGEKITSAIQWINGLTYFFSHKYYYRYDHVHQQVADSYPTYPRPISEWWLQCNPGASPSSSSSSLSSAYSDLPRWKRAAIIFESNYTNVENSNYNSGRCENEQNLFLINISIFIITYYL